MPKRKRTGISLKRLLKRSDKKLRKIDRALIKEELAEMLAFLESAKDDLK